MHLNVYNFYWLLIIIKCRCAKTYSTPLILADITNWSGTLMGFPGGSLVKNTSANVGDLGSVPGLRSSGEGNGNPLQYSCLGNPVDGGIFRLQSMGLQRVGHDLATEHACMHTVPMLMVILLCSSVCFSNMYIVHIYAFEYL